MSEKLKTITLTRGVRYNWRSSLENILQNGYLSKYNVDEMTGILYLYVKQPKNAGKVKMKKEKKPERKTKKENNKNKCKSCTSGKSQRSKLTLPGVNPTVIRVKEKPVQTEVTIPAHEEIAQPLFTDHKNARLKPQEYLPLENHESKQKVREWTTLSFTPTKESISLPQLSETSKMQSAWATSETKQQNKLHSIPVTNCPRKEEVNCGCSCRTVPPQSTNIRSPSPHLSCQANQQWHGCHNRPTTCPLLAGAFPRNCNCLTETGNPKMVQPSTRETWPLEAEFYRTYNDQYSQLERYASVSMKRLSDGIPLRRYDTPEHNLLNYHSKIPVYRENPIRRRNEMSYLNVGPKSQSQDISDELKQEFAPVQQISKGTTLWKLYSSHYFIVPQREYHTGKYEEGTGRKKELRRKYGVYSFQDSFEQSIPGRPQGTQKHISAYFPSKLTNWPRTSENKRKYRNVPRSEKTELEAYQEIGNMSREIPRTNLVFSQPNRLKKVYSYYEVVNEPSALDIQQKEELPGGKVGIHNDEVADVNSSSGKTTSKPEVYEFLLQIKNILSQYFAENCTNAGKLTNECKEIQKQMEEKRRKKKCEEPADNYSETKKARTSNRAPKKKKEPADNTSVSGSKKKSRHLLGLRYCY